MRRTEHNQSATARAALAILLLAMVPAAAQDVTEPALKAAYIYNFAKFTEWPAEAMTAGAPLVLCVQGDEAIGKELERAVKGRKFGGRDIGVSLGVSGRPVLGRCHVLYVTGVPVTEAGRVVAGVRDAPVLTISDLNGFTRHGGIAELFFENGQLRFDVQVESAKRARLQISSRLLALITKR
jgi:hypothetical protein